MANLSSGESSKLQSPQKAHLLGELADGRRRMTHKDEEIRQLVEMLQRLEEAQVRQTQERKWELCKATRNYMHYGSQEDDQDWRVNHFEERRHQHQSPQPYFLFVKLPSFIGESDPNFYLGWEAKVEQICNVYEVDDDQKVKLASLEFVDYTMQWWH